MLNLYLNKSNIIKIQLQSDRAPANLGNVTKIVVKIDDVTIDSSDSENVVNEYITWLDYKPGINDPNLFLKLGKHPDLLGCEGYRELRVIIFDDSNINGLVWIDQLPITLINELDPISITTPNEITNYQFIGLENNDLLVYSVPNGRWENKKLRNVPYVLTDNVIPINNGEMFFQLSDNSTLIIKVKGSDGIIRSTSLTLS